MNEDKKQLKIFITEDYASWLYAMSKYAPAVPLNILAQMQPQKTGEERDYQLNPLCSFFNAALQLNKDQIGLVDYKLFMLLYFGRYATWYFKDAGHEAVNIKQMAHNMGVSEQACYTRAHNFAESSYNTAVNTMRMNEKVQSMIRSDVSVFKAKGLKRVA